MTSNVVGLTTPNSPGTDIKFERSFGLVQVGHTLTAHMTADRPLPDTIEYQAMNIVWELSLDGGATWHTLRVGQSRNGLFVTGGAAPAAYETGLWLATKDRASGLRPRNLNEADTPKVGQPVGPATGKDRAVVDAVWTNFSGSTASGAGSTPIIIERVNGTPLMYDHHGNPATTAPAMLANSFGRGECDAWPDLLVQTLKVDGVSSTSFAIRPDASRGFAEFEVRAMPAQGSGTGSYTFAGVSTPFVFHQLVFVPVYSARIYDPSHGDFVDSPGTIRATKIQYEDVNVNHNTKRVGANPAVPY